MDVHRTPDERFEGLPDFPFEPHYADVDGLRVHHLDEGPPDAEPILLLHGEPTWSYVYRRMLPMLVGAGYRCVAPDYVGFGRSDKPTDLGAYTYDLHVRTIIELVKMLDLSSITLVVQDWGGPIGFRFAVEHPERMARLVMLNTGIVAPSDRWPTPAFLRWRAFAERAGLDLPIGFVIQSATATDPPPEVLAAYEAPFDTRQSKAGAAVFPLLVPLTMDDPGAKEMLETRDALSRWDKPAFVCFGDADPIFPPKAAASLARLVPTAGEAELVTGASHFVQEDRGEEVARRILAFLARS